MVAEPVHVPLPVATAMEGIVQHRMQNTPNQYRSEQSSTARFWPPSSTSAVSKKSALAHPKSKAATSTLTRACAGDRAPLNCQPWTRL